MAALAAIVGTRHLRVDDDSRARYGSDRSGMYDPAPAAVALPGTTDEVAAIVRLANEQGFAIVPSGGRTGLSGGACACHGELVVALDRMNHILGFDAPGRSVACQGGVITAQLQQYAAERGLYYPVDFAASGSSQIGGNVSTNAGGIRVIRYGMTRDQVLGLQVVTGAGQVLELNHGLVKNNTGYDLRHLFIGAEGTLGIVTEVTMALTRPPRNLRVLLLAVPDFGALMEVLQHFRGQLDLTAFEFFSEAALAKVIASTGLARPLANTAPLYALLEFDDDGEWRGEQALAAFEYCAARGWAEDGTLSQDNRQAATLWRLREDISTTLARWTPYKNDLSVTVSQVPAFVAELTAAIEDGYPGWDVISYGHIGDGNVHINILKPDELSREQFSARCDRVSEDIFRIVRHYRGSISAEHGVGLLKKPYLGYTRAAEEIALMRQFKAVFDPRGIMNPGKIFD